MSEHQIELILVLLLAVVVLATVADHIHIPYPMLLLVGGMVLAIAPGLPRIELEPHLVFIIFLPPILFYSAYFTSWRDFKQNLRPIGLLAIGCVFLTMALVAVAARMLIPDMPWSVALTLGAIVSPPDAVATTAIFQRLGAPRRVVTILEGESLVNDASALIAYRFAVAAVVGGTFSVVEASGQFVYLSVGGVILGLAAGWVMAKVAPYIREQSVAIAFTLLMPAGTYLVAERIHLSGVLAVVAAGLYFGRKSTQTLTSQGRIGGRAVWETVILVINGIVFIMIGLQLPHLIDDIHGTSIWTLIGQSLAISLTVIVARFVWMFPVTYIQRLVIPGLRERDPTPKWESIFLIAWSGLRGVVSLASALALPLVLDDGSPFPYRDDIIFMTFGVIVVTLLGQGTLIPWLIRRLGVTDDGSIERETIHARVLVAKAALAHLDTIQHEPWVPQDHQAILRYRYMHELELKTGTLEHVHDHVERNARLQLEVITAGRTALIQARNRGEIGDEARVRIEGELDFEELSQHI